jgi:Capsule assembly protein Wzi
MGTSYFGLSPLRSPHSALRSFLPLLFVIFSAASAVAGEPGVPAESWVYRELDRLRAAGLVESGTAGFRPRSRAELARLTEEARRLAGERNESRFDAGLTRLESEFEAELENRSAGSDVNYFRPLDEVRVSYLFADGDDNDVQNDRGREYHEGSNARLSLSSRGRWGPLSGYLRWEGRWLEDDGEQAEVTAGRIEEGHLRLSVGSWYLEVGRESLWWGPGRHGSLLMSNNARPMDMLRIGNDQPFLLPGFLSRLGPVRVEAFLTRLEQERAVPKPFLAGARVEISPLPGLALGASRVAMFGGSDHSITWDTIGDLVDLRENDNSNVGGNQLASVDWRVTVPWQLQPFEFYGEFGGEDEAGMLFSKDAYIIGLYLPRLGPLAMFDFRVEHADTWFGGHGGKDRIWYRHGEYASGYTHEGRIIGHHAGTDARDWYFELGVHPRRDLRVWFSVDLEERELSFDDPEQRDEFGAGLEWQITGKWTVSASWVHEEIKDALGSGDDDGDRVRLEVSWKF